MQNLKANRVHYGQLENSHGANRMQTAIRSKSIDYLLINKLVSRMLTFLKLAI